MPVEERVLELYVNSKIPLGRYTDGPNGGRWVDSGTVPIPDGSEYYDHSTEITAKNPNEPDQWGHQVLVQRRQGDAKIIGVMLAIHCENHPIFGQGRWYGVRLRVQVRFPEAVESGPELALERVEAKTK